MIQLDQRYQKHPSIVSREIAGEVILIPIRHKVGDLEGIYTLNETGARTWMLMDGKRTLAQIRDKIIDEYDVDIDQTENDLLELVDQLISIGALEIV